MNIIARRYWFAPHDATTYALGFGDKEIAVLADAAVPYLAQEIVAHLNAYDELVAALNAAISLLRKYADPEEMGGARFDLTDCPEMQPLFAALAKVTP